MKKLNEMNERIAAIEETQNSICVTVGAMILIGAVALPVVGVIKGTKAICGAVKRHKEKKVAAEEAAAAAKKEEAEEASHEF